MSSKIINGFSKISKNKWNDFLVNNTFTTAFQTPDFYNFYNLVPNCSAEVFAVEDNGKLTALCLVTFQKEEGLLGYFSRRAIIYGGPVLSDAGNKALPELLSVIRKNLKGKVIYAEIRCLNDYSGFNECFKEVGWAYESYLNYHITYSSDEKLWADLNGNKKRQIKKAFQSGTVILEAEKIEEVKKYYDILSDLYKNKIKKPLITFDFFKLLFEKKIGRYFLVKFKNQIIGGTVCIVLEGETVYELYACGLDRGYKDQSPSAMATYAAIEFGLKNGFKKFDFMGAGKPDEDYGVRDFKAKFGGDLIEYGRFVTICNPILFQVGKAGLNVLKKIKNLRVSFMRVF